MKLLRKLLLLLAVMFLLTPSLRSYASDNSDLLSAAEKGDINTVTLLLNKGVNVNAKYLVVGETALMLAASRGNQEIVKLLLDKGADVNAKSKRGDTALMFATDKKSNQEIVKLLLDKGADVNAKSSAGGTALIYAAGNGYQEIVKLLLDKGADVNAKKKRGGTALMIAADDVNQEIVKLLLDKGAGKGADASVEDQQILVRKAEEEKLLNDFLKKYGVEKQPQVSDLSANPFVYENKTIAIGVMFKEMLSATQGAFTDIVILNRKRITDMYGDATVIVSDIPKGTFTKSKTMVTLAVRVIGKTKKTDTTEAGLLHVKFVGAL